MTISKEAAAIHTQDVDFQTTEHSNTYIDNFLILNDDIKHIEICISIIYPITIILGVLLKLGGRIHESYFSHSSNIFNTIFVKLGWFWTSLIFIYHLSRVQSKNIFKACVRWFFTTLWWIVITQWFFGPPIMDRIFIWTGGSCKFNKVEPNKTETHTLYSSSECKLDGGKWTGGYDFSGHGLLNYTI